MLRLRDEPAGAAAGAAMRRGSCWSTDSLAAAAPGDALTLDGAVLDGAALDGAALVDQLSAADADWLPRSATIRTPRKPRTAAMIATTAAAINRKRVERAAPEGVSGCSATGALTGSTVSCSCAES